MVLSHQIPIRATRMLTGDKIKWRDALYYHYYKYPDIHMVKRHYGIRTVDYKLIHFYYAVDEWELYDLNKDPEELSNVYNHPGYKQIKSELIKKLNELRIQYHDSDELTRRILEEDLDERKK